MESEIKVLFHDLIKDICEKRENNADRWETYQKLCALMIELQHSKNPFDLNIDIISHDLFNECF